RAVAVPRRLAEHGRGMCNRGWPVKFCARWIVLPFVLVLGGCVAVPDWRAEAPIADAQCLALLADMDEAVAAHDVGDAGAARIKTFPWLRIDRFLASFRHELSAPGAFEDWVSHLRWLDARAREIEASNLPQD